MNNIDSIVIHCSATPEGRAYTAKDITQWHKERGFSTIGYHFVIDLDGKVEAGRPLTMEGAHCNTSGTTSVSYNKHSIGICYIGGLDAAGKAKDTRTPAQKKSMHALIEELKGKYKIKDILGHRDASPDKNKDGKITKNEWLKDCPCFDVRAEFKV